MKTNPFGIEALDVYIKYPTSEGTLNYHLAKGHCSVYIELSALAFTLACFHGSDLHMAISGDVDSITEAVQTCFLID